MLKKKQQLLLLRLWVEVRLQLGEDISDVFGCPISLFDYKKIIEQIWDKNSEIGNCELVNDYPELKKWYKKLTSNK